MTKKNKTKNVQQKKKKATPFSDAGSIAGNHIGRMFNMPQLKGIGKWLGSGIGQIFGSGDYNMVGSTPQYNVLTSDRQIPRFSTAERTNIVCHREYIGDIQGTTGFSNRSYPLNPGMSQTFPWLASVAKNYQEYTIHGMIFEFRPLITDFVTGGAPGVVVLATNYNSDRAVYRSRLEMENSEYAVSVKPTNNLIHGIECSPTETPVTRLYVRSGAVPAGQDLRLYDLGQTQFATQSNPLQTLGELWVSYCVEFFKPILADDAGIDALSLVLTRSVITNTNFLGDIGGTVFGDLPGVTANSTSITFAGAPPGTYLINYESGADVAVAVTVPTATFTGGLLATPYFFNRSQSSWVLETGTVTRRLFANFSVELDDTRSGVMTFGAGVVPTGNSAATITISKVDTL